MAWTFARFIARPGKLGTVDSQSIHQQLQRILVDQHQANLRLGTRSHEDIAQAGFRCHSQFEEDGIILYVLATIGMKTKKGRRDLHRGRRGVHGHQPRAQSWLSGFSVRRQRPEHQPRQPLFRVEEGLPAHPPALKAAWVTKDNINGLLREAGAQGEVDLLSLDMDGNDYYIWEATTEISPRLCVFETHDIVPSNLSITIPYEDDFNCWAKAGPDQDFRSASLLAMKKLSERKGYRLIGAHRHGFNVFFLRNDIARDIFPEVSIEKVHDNPWTRAGQRDRWPLVCDKNWVEV